MPEVDAIQISIDRSLHTVLVVDDHPTTRYTTARVLRAGGFKTIEASTGQEALDLSTGDISAVVLDVHLPDIGGFEVCKILRQRESTMVLPVVHLSAAYVEDADKVAGLDAGADAYLIHPAQPAVLIATVQALIRARMAEERLRRSEEKFKAIYTQAESGIALIDAGGRFRDANPAMLRMLGRSADQVIGRAIAEFATPESQARVEQHTGGEAPGHEEFALVNGAGDVVHLEWSISVPVENDMRVAVVSNVSERIQFERRRQLLLEREQAARAAAERHSRTKDDFVAVLSHELRNPLNAIMMNVHVLQRKGAAADLAKGLEVIRRNANTQARIISDILDVSRINSGKLTLQREPTDPAALIASSLDAMKPMVEGRRLQVVADLADGTGTLSLDPARFQQIFWNIFNNAVKFSHPEGVVHVTLRRTHNLLTLTVTDAGKGIDPAFIGRVFEKFTQSDAPGNRQQGGLGLGMSIVKHLVELHAGHVAVASEGLGSGTTVTVEIPAEAARDDGAGGPAETLPAALEDAAYAVLSGLRIVVVEDDLEAGEILAHILEDRGATVALAGDHDTALALLASHRPDLMVSDIGLPGKDGYELLRSVRRREGASGRLPAIALTAFGREDDQNMALDAGFDVHLSKPLEPQTLLQAIRRLVGHGSGR